MNIGKTDIVLITGGGTGIGRGLAEALYRLGTTVIISGRSVKKLETVAAAHPGMIAERVDVSDPQSIQALANRLTEKFPHLTVLVNNAGIQRLIDFSQDSAPTASVLTEEIDTNLKGLLYSTAAFLPLLRRAPQRAAIIQIGSGLAYVPLIAAPIYSATKAAVHSFTISLREQLRGSKIRVIEIIPPVVETDLHNGQSRKPPKAMKLDAFIHEALTGLSAGKEEIPVGLAKNLRLGSRIAPDLFLKIINRS